MGSYLCVGGPVHGRVTTTRDDRLLVPVYDQQTRTMIDEEPTYAVATTYTTVHYRVTPFVIDRRRTEVLLHQDLDPQQQSTVQLVQASLTQLATMDQLEAERANLLRRLRKAKDQLSVLRDQLEEGGEPEAEDLTFLINSCEYRSHA